MDDKNKDKSITVYTANKQCRIKLLAVPLPKAVTDLLEEYGDILKAVTRIQQYQISDRLKMQVEELKSALVKAFEESEDRNEVLKVSGIIDKIWCLGPKKCGTNILLNLSDFKHKPFWNLLNAGDATKSNEDGNKDIRSDLESSFLNGYQLATLAGPLCEEPMHGVCLVIQEWHFDDTNDSNIATGPISGKFFFRFCEGYCWFHMLFP